MFEAYARNKYTSTGVIQWMLNNAWPSMIWHLYDYYLRPGGGYFGTKKACEPLHVQYSYDDRSVVVVNDTWTGAQGPQGHGAGLRPASLKTLFADEATVDVARRRRGARVRDPGSGRWRCTVRPISCACGCDDAAGQLVSSNFYWLSTRDDVLDWEKTEWFYTPTKRHADLTALSSLPATTLTLKVAPGNSAADAAARATGSAAAVRRAAERRAVRQLSPVGPSTSPTPGRRLRFRCTSRRSTPPPARKWCRCFGTTTTSR